MRHFCSIVSFFALTLVASSAHASTSGWPRFGGPNANFQVDAELASSWGDDGPRELWVRELGLGYSGVAEADEVLYTMYLDGDSDVVVALDAGDGSTLWEHRYPNVPLEGHQVQFGRGPHATPLVAGERLVTLGYAGVLQAFDRASGRVLWSHDLHEDLGGGVLPWGYSASPILHEGKIIVLVGGRKQGVVALDPADGSTVWASAPTSVSYASPIVIEVDGSEQLLYFAADALHALDPATGAALWSESIVNGYRNHASMPVWNGDGLLWVVTQQEGGARVLRLSSGDGGPKAERLWTNGKVRVHIWNSIRVDDTVYASIGEASVLGAVDVATGEVLWRERGFSQANLVHTSSGTVALDQKGGLSLVDLSRDGVTVRSRTQLPDGVYWTAPTLVGGRLFVRNKRDLRALAVGPAVGAVSVDRPPAAR